MKHTLRSAPITPIVTLLGLDVAVLLAGNAILTETVFNIPGVGAETRTGTIKRSDLPMIRGSRCSARSSSSFVVVDIACASIRG